LFTDAFDNWLTSESLVITTYVPRGNETLCQEVPGGRGLVDGTVGPGLEDDLINSHRLLTQHQLTVVLSKISLFKLVCGPKEKHFLKREEQNPWSYGPNPMNL
jgi:hypothetical protein